ncbi:MAG: hypothetical protein KA838_07385, partial [Burkholderiaceae bacterium]|nr:hypothetical protein [Burkholderiaceae bacterium]
MKMLSVLGAVWRRLPLSIERKRNLKTWILRRWPSIQPQVALAAGMAVSVGPVASKSPSLPLRAPHRETPAGQRDWLVFSIIGWDFRIQRPQHLARELSRTGNATFYIEPHFIAD